MRPAESFIEQSVRSLQTMLRVISKDTPSLPTIIPDGIYGPTTMNAVSAFQRKNDLPVTGITDQQTWERIAQAYEDTIINIGKAEPIEILIESGQVYRIGDSNPYIYLLQSMLIQLSNDHLTINRPEHNGVLDEQTANAVRAFQALSDLPETGDVDRITWKNLVLQFTLNAHHNEALNRATEVL